jgi:hypothetical protein
MNANNHIGDRAALDTVAVLISGTPHTDDNTALTAKDLIGYIVGELDNIDIYGIRAEQVPLNAIERLEAGSDVAALSPEVWLDIATAFTCIEADTLAQLLRCFDNPEAADAFLSAHAQGDTEGDLHHPATTSTGVGA